MPRDLSLVFEPITVGPRTLRSRIYVPAHQPGLADDGAPGARYIAYHRERARAGVGMQITGATPVIHSDLWPRHRMLVNADDSIVPGYQALTRAVHDEGGLMLAQLAHPGPGDIGDDTFAASPVLSELTRHVAREATIDDIRGAIDAYAAAAGRCCDGDLDGVEIMMAYGYLLTSFLSPALNRRTDAYGGSLEGRLRLPREVIAAVRARVGRDRIVGIRLVADELYDGGLTVDDAPAVAAGLAASGEIDYISVIAGNNLRRLPRVEHWPPSPAAHGLFRHLARAVRAAVDVPVATVGRVTTPALAEDILAAGDADLVGMVRAHVADPQLLVKARHGRAAQIRPCTGVNVCMNLLLDEQPIRCLANPEVGYEGEIDESPLPSGYRAHVIGGGVAGLEAARRLAVRGAAVVLHEATTELGGQVRRWSAAPSRREVRLLLSWWGAELERSDVDVRLGSAVSPAAILADSPDLVIVATGARPRRRQLGGTASFPTIDAIDAFAADPVAGHVVVWDEMGRADALLVAEHLAATGSAVTVVTSCLHAGEDEGIVTLYKHLERLAELQVVLRERLRPETADGTSLALEGVFGESARIDGVDLLVTCHGADPNGQLASALDGRIPVVTVGDARLPRRALDAVRDGAAAAWNVATTTG